MKSTKKVDMVKSATFMFSGNGSGAKNATKNPTTDPTVDPTTTLHTNPTTTSITCRS